MLHIYLEKEFLDDFYLDYDEDSASMAQNVVFKILVEYPETKWFIDYPVETPKQLNALKLNNPFIALKSDYFAPFPIEKISLNHIKVASDKSIMVFSAENKDWFAEAEEKGILCFSLANYKKRIKEIINKYHYRIDLSKERFEWSEMNFLPVFNSININDNYILTDKSAQKIDDNFAPLLKKTLNNNKKEVSIKIYTKDFNPLPPRGPEQVKQAVEKRKQKLDRVFANFKIKFKIINNAVGGAAAFDFHDRMLISNFQIIESGKGFNLIPHKKSNSQIISETIFDLYTYKRAKRLFKAHQEYYRNITRESFQTLEFSYL